MVVERESRPRFRPKTAAQLPKAKRARRNRGALAVSLGWREAETAAKDYPMIAKSLTCGRQRSKQKSAPLQRGAVGPAADALGRSDWVEAMLPLDPLARSHGRGRSAWDDGAFSKQMGGHGPATPHRVALPGLGGIRKPKRASPPVGQRSVAAGAFSTCHAGYHEVACRLPHGRRNDNRPNLTGAWVPARVSALPPRSRALDGAARRLRRLRASRPRAESRARRAGGRRRSFLPGAIARRRP